MVEILHIVLSGFVLKLFFSVQINQLTYKSLIQEHDMIDELTNVINGYTPPKPHPVW